MLKTLAWVLGIIILLLVAVLTLAQLPAVQTRLAQEAASFVSRRTHTPVRIQKIAIGFPGTVRIEHLFAADLSRDTLIYAGSISAGIDLTGLLQHRLDVSFLEVDSVNLRLARTPNDSSFNFNFLIRAFASGDKPKKEVADAKTDTTKKSFAINPGKVHLQKIRVLFDDRYGGTSLSVSLNELALRMDHMDLDKLDFDYKDVYINGLKTSVMLGEGKKTTAAKDTVPGKMPLIHGDKIILRNVQFTYEAPDRHERLAANAGLLEVDKTEVLLAQQKVSIGKLLLAGSDVSFKSAGAEPKQNAPAKDINPSSGSSSWKISARTIELLEDRFKYDADTNARTNGFDPAHISLDALSMKADNAFYSSDSMSVQMKALTVTDLSRFSLKKMKGKLVMTPRRIGASDVEMITSNSSLRFSAGLWFSSLASLKDSLSALRVEAAFRPIHVSVKDLLYFSPSLSQKPFLDDPSNYVTLYGSFKGRVDNIRGKNIVIRTARQTELRTDIAIRGLPDVKKAFFDVTGLDLATGAEDLHHLAGNALPSGIAWPDTLKLKGKWSGTLNAFKGSIGLVSDLGNASVEMKVEESGSYSAGFSAEKFDLGKLLKKQSLLGPVSCTVAANGAGWLKPAMSASVDASVSEARFNGYTYHDLQAQGQYASKAAEGTVSLHDEYADFTIQGKVNLNQGNEQLSASLDLKGIDLQKLNFYKEDLRIAMKGKVNLKGRQLDSLNGDMGISGLVITHNGKMYLLDSVLAAAVNKEGRNEFNLKSAVVSLKYQGDIEPGRLKEALTDHLYSYFHPANFTPPAKPIAPATFSFDLEVNDHPVLSEVFLPGLTNFSGIQASGRFSSRDKILNLDVGLKDASYNSITVKNFSMAVRSDASSLTPVLSIDKLVGPQVKVENVAMKGKLANDKAEFDISSTDSAGGKKLLVRPVVTAERSGYKVHIDPSQFYLMNSAWQVAEDNYVLTGKEGFMIHNLAISRLNSEVKLNSPANKFNDDVELKVKEFSLETISGILEKDTNLVKGFVNGNVVLKRSQSTYGLIADLGISGLQVREYPLGDLAVKADQTEKNKFSFDLSLKGNGNDLRTKGALITQQGKQMLNLEVKLQPLAIKSIEALSFGQVTGASGNLEGSVSIKGELKDPSLEGSLTFKNASLNPHITNSPIYFSNETISLSGRRLSFNSFTLVDKNKHKAVINGTIDFEKISDPVFGLTVNTNDFLLMNSTSENNKEAFGRVIIDSKIKVKGSAGLPVINSSISLKNGTNFVFVVPETKLTTDRGEGVVVFEDTMKLSRILIRNSKTEMKKSDLKGIDLSSTIHIEKKAILKLLPDPSGSDTLVAQGNADLSLSIDAGGKLSLTGLYQLTDGSYQVSLESVVKKQFRIAEGSTIAWNGDPLDAELDLRAVYSVRASPIDLVADQVSGLSESDKNGYKQNLPFLVYLKLHGPLLKPEISFEITLPANEKGALGGSVNAKLEQLSEDPSSLNKQVFALLVLGRFVQENPLQSDAPGGAENAVRSTVGKFLSSELNQLSAKYIPGVELNFDVQSYDDNISGGNTAVSVGVKKQLFNERISVQLGGTVDVEGEGARQNNASDITGDVLMEYKVTSDGRYRLKGFRRNQYEGAIEGQILETGGGVLFVKDFDKWDEVFHKKEKDKQKETKTKDTKYPEADEKTTSK